MSYYLDSFQQIMLVTPPFHGGGGGPKVWMCPHHVASEQQGLAITQEPQPPIKLRKLSATLLGNRKCQNQATGEGGG